MSTVIERLEALAGAGTPRPWWNETHVLHAKGPDWTEDNHACVHPAATSLDYETYFDDAELIAAAVNALPDLLKVVRAAFADIASRECEEAPFGPCGKCDYCVTAAALEPLFREAQQ